jgi:hypothetical protein
MDLFRFFRSMYDVGCQFVKKEDTVDSKVTNQETSTVSVHDNVFNHLRFVYIYLGLFNLTLSTWQQVCERHDINQPSAFYTCFTNYLNIKI